jgi:hypothetical protein
MSYFPILNYLKIPKKRILAKIAIFFVFVSPLSHLAMANDAETISTEIAFFPLDGGSWAGLYFMPRGERSGDLSPIRFNPLARSPYSSYSGPIEFSIYARAVDQDGVERILPISTINLHPTAARQMLLIEENGRLLSDVFPNVEFTFQRGPNRELKSFVFVDSPQTFPPESIVFFNTMPATFYGVLGNRRITLEPGLSQPIILTELLGRDLRMGLALHDGDRNRRVLDSNFRFGDNRRTLFILRPPAREGSLRLRSQRLTEYLGN